MRTGRRDRQQEDGRGLVTPCPSKEAQTLHVRGQIAAREQKIRSRLLVIKPRRTS